MWFNAAPMDNPTRSAPASTAWPRTDAEAAAVEAVAARTVAVAGASGLVGREILQGLLADKGVVAVHALGRRPLELQHPKLHFHQVDFAAPAALNMLPPLDEVYLAL